MSYFRKLTIAALIIFARVGYGQISNPAVTSINSNTGAFTFSGAGVSCTGTTCTFSGGSGGGNVSTTTSNTYAAGTTQAMQTATEVTNTAASSNGVIHPNVCSNTSPPSWCSGSDIGAWTNAAITQFGCATYVIDAGTYSDATTIHKTQCATIQGAGRLNTTINFSPASGVLFTVGDATTSGSGTTVGKISDLTAIATNASNTAVGLFEGGDPAGVIQPSTYYAPSETYENLAFFGFNIAEEYGNNVWNTVRINVQWLNSITAGIAMASGAGNVYEVNKYFGGVIANGTNAAVTGCPECVFYGTSFDYNNGGGTVNGAPDITVPIYCHGCFFEKNYGPITNAGGNFYGGFINEVGTTGTDNYLFLATDNVNYNIDGVKLGTMQHAITTFLSYSGGTGNWTHIYIHHMMSDNNFGNIGSIASLSGTAANSYEVEDPILHTTVGNTGVALAPGNWTPLTTATTLACNGGYLGNSTSALTQTMPTLASGCMGALLNENTGTQTLSTSGNTITCVTPSGKTTGTTCDVPANQKANWSTDGTNWLVSVTVAPPSQPADTTATVSTTAIPANSCTAQTAITMTGLTTGMAVNFTATSDTSSVTGWGSPSAGLLYITDYPTTNTVNWKVCNGTAASITPSASVTFNVSAR